MRLKRYLFFIAMLAGAASVEAQSPQQADASFQQGDFVKAADEYHALLQRDARSQLYLYRYARCQYELGEMAKAAEYFERAGERYALRNYYLGEIYIRLYRPTEALVCLGKYAATIDENHERYPNLVRLIDRATFLQRLMTRVEQVEIVDSVDVPANQWLSAYSLSPEAGILSRSGYMSERGDRRIRVQEGALYRQEKLLNTWSDPEKLDLLAGMELGYPYLLSDGVTLYFAARPLTTEVEADTLGGWDLYMTKYNSATESYLNPVMLPLPFCSMADDYMMAFDETKGLAYWATNRGKTDGHLTVYTFRPHEIKAYWRDSTEQFLAKEVMAPRISQIDTSAVSASTIHDEETSSADLPDPMIQDEKKTTTDSQEEIWSGYTEEQVAPVLAIDEQIEALRQRLATLRRQYAALSTEELTQQIVAAEQELMLLNQQKKEALKTVNQ